MPLARLGVNDPGARLRGPAGASTAISVTTSLFRLIIVHPHLSRLALHTLQSGFSAHRPAAPAVRRSPLRRTSSVQFSTKTISERGPWCTIANRVPSGDTS